ncbi:MAG: alpha/beta hydrolase family protein [Fermentimonas sp.]|jgi:hypothetical protein
MKRNVGILIAWLCASVLFAQHEVNYDEEKVPKYVLPELLQLQNGERVKSVEQWEKQRRPEIMELFASEVYGRTPTDRINVVYETITENPNALRGKATARQVRFTFSSENGDKDRAKSVSENETREAILLLYIPNKRKGKVPIFVGYNFNGNHSITHEVTVLYPPTLHLVKKLGSPEWERGNQTRRWPLEMIIDRGYAIATMCYHDIFPDNPRMKERSVIPLFTGYTTNSTGTTGSDANRNTSDEWQALSAWAWGSSRIVDFLETREEIDSDKIAIMGHSRQGKAALWAGAQDKRFKVVISNDSGCGGAALFRREFGETIDIINNAFPHWFCGNFQKYNKREPLLPVDQHQLIALIAPRKAYVASAEEDLWADPKGEFLSAYHAGPVYRLYGLSAINSEKMPELHAPIMEDIGYHIRAGKHDVTDYDWKCYLDFADKHFKK